MKKLITTAIILLMILSCSKTKQESHKNSITVSILPQKFFAEKITGGKFKINVLLPPGVSPHTYEPVLSFLKDLSESEIYFTVGQLDFEVTWMDRFKAVNPSLLIVETSKGADFIVSNEHHHEDEHAEHGHEGADPHIWMSPKEVKVMCANMLEAILKADPLNKEFYQTNYDLFVKDLDKLDMQIRTMLSDLKQRKFIIYHPALSYFARDYGLEEISVEMNGKDPAPDDLKKLIDTALSDGIKTIFVQKQFDARQAESVASEIGGTVMPLDHLSEDWINNLILIARTIQYGQQ
jgi:zinc transport system substrate-binding protein